MEINISDLIIFAKMILMCSLKARIAYNAKKQGWRTKWIDSNTLELRKKLSKIPDYESFDVNVLVEELTC